MSMKDFLFVRAIKNVAASWRILFRCAATICRSRKVLSIVRYALPGWRRATGARCAPVEQLQAIFGYRNVNIFPERVFMPGIGKLLDADGNFAKPEMEKRLQKHAESFVGFVESLSRKALSP